MITQMHGPFLSAANLVLRKQLLSGLQLIPMILLATQCESDGSLSSNRQWGVILGVASGSVVTLPISATPRIVIPVDINDKSNSLIYSTVKYTNGSFTIYGNRVDGNTDVYATWLAICA